MTNGWNGTGMPDSVCLSIGACIPFLPAANGSAARSEMTKEEYQKYFEEFDARDFNPKEWARMAKEAGMKYMVLTAKHHDGFCLFDSKYTEYKATNTKGRAGSGAGICGCSPCGRAEGRPLFHSAWTGIMKIILIIRTGIIPCAIIRNAEMRTGFQPLCGLHA